MIDIINDEVNEKVQRVDRNSINTVLLVIFFDKPDGQCDAQM